VEATQKLQNEIRRAMLPQTTLVGD